MNETCVLSRCEWWGDSHNDEERSGKAVKAEKGKAYKMHTFELAELALSA